MGAITADVEAVRAVQAVRATAAPAVWTQPDRGVVGMASFIVAESAIFTIFVVAYLFYLGKSLTGPTPRDVLEVPIFYTVCLLSSSVTIHLAGIRLERNQRNRFLLWWLTTIGLGATFMFGTAQEWRRLIYEHGLTISTNLFGTTYYSLVGLHAFHVTVGLVMLTIVAWLSTMLDIRRQSRRIAALSLYWHFVDVVWVVVFTVVYVIGR
jgi:cytochrome c oxidase subunit 3